MAFEAKLAALEGTEAARGFASGMAAISSTVLAFLAAGERMVCVRHCYPDAYRLFRRLLPRLGIEVTFVDGRDLGAVAEAVDGAKLLYLESPTSVVFETHDVRALAGLARDAGAVSVIDNSWATPLFQQPHQLGVDLVIHSASKYISGHSDTVAGVVCGSAVHIDRINRLTYPFLGGKLAPFEAFLLLRGLRTLQVRLKRQEASALAVAQWLVARPEVARVNHPALQQAQGLSGTTSLFSIELAPAVDVTRFCDSLELFRLGVELGRPREPGISGRRRSTAGRRAQQPRRFRCVAAARAPACRARIARPTSSPIWTAPSAPRHNDRHTASKGRTPHHAHDAY